MVFSARWVKKRVRTVPLVAGLLLSSNVGERGGSDKGRERPLGAVDLTVTDGGLFEGRGSNLGEVLKILEDIVAKGVDIADLDDVIEREVQKME